MHVVMHADTCKKDGGGWAHHSPEVKGLLLVHCCSCLVQLPLRLLLFVRCPLLPCLLACSPVSKLLPLAGCNGWPGIPCSCLDVIRIPAGQAVGCAACLRCLWATCSQGLNALEGKPYQISGALDCWPPKRTVAPTGCMHVPDMPTPAGHIQAEEPSKADAPRQALHTATRRLTLTQRACCLHDFGQPACLFTGAAGSMQSWADLWHSAHLGAGEARRARCSCKSRRVTWLAM